MTEEEFIWLRCGIVISDRFDKNKYYVIDSESVFGCEPTNNEDVVYGAKELDGYSYIRIDKNNAQFWKIEGEIRKK